MVSESIYFREFLRQPAICEMLKVFLFDCSLLDSARAGEGINNLQLLTALMRKYFSFAKDKRKFNKKKSNIIQLFASFYSFFMQKHKNHLKYTISILLLPWQSIHEWRTRNFFFYIFFLKLIKIPVCCTFHVKYFSLFKKFDKYSNTQKKNAEIIWGERKYANLV